MPDRKPYHHGNLREALIEAAPGCEIWLDGGHNPAGALAVAATLAALPPREHRAWKAKVQAERIEQRGLCDFFAVWRNAVAPGRAARVFIDALLAVHHG